MTIAMLTAKFSLPESHSLKDKRQVVRSVKERILARMNMSVAETGRQDAWQFAELTFVTVAGERSIAESRIAELSKTLHLEHRMVLLDLSTQYL